MNNFSHEWNSERRELCDSAGEHYCYVRFCVLCGYEQDVSKPIPDWPCPEKVIREVVRRLGDQREKRGNL